jgi:hypothetical protein
MFRAIVAVSAILTVNQQAAEKLNADGTGWRVRAKQAAEKVRTKGTASAVPKKPCSRRGFSR